MKPLLNQNNTLITIFDRKRGGYNLYETCSLKRVSEDDDYQVLYGPLRFFVPFYESPICFFVGTAYNLNFPPDQIIIWNESKKRKAGIILLKGACDDLKVRKEFLVCLVEFQVLVFDIFKMDLVLILEDCNNYFPIEISFHGSPAIIAYQSRSQPTQVKITKLKLEEFSSNEIEEFVKQENKKNGCFVSDWGKLFKISSKLQYVVATMFNEIFKIEVSEKVRISFNIFHYYLF